MNGWEGEVSPVIGSGSLVLESLGARYSCGSELVSRGTGSTFWESTLPFHFSTLRLFCQPGGVFLTGICSIHQGGSLSFYIVGPHHGLSWLGA